MRRVLEKEDEFSYNPSINKKVDERSVTDMLCLSKKMKMMMVAASFMTFTGGTAMVYAAPPPPNYRIGNGAAFPVFSQCLQCGTI